MENINLNNRNYKNNLKEIILKKIYSYLIVKNTYKCKLLKEKILFLSKLEENFLFLIFYGILIDFLNINNNIHIIINRSNNEISPIEYSIILISNFELFNKFDAEFRIIINESIEIVKLFGNFDSHKFINSMLDKICSR